MSTLYLHGTAGKVVELLEVAGVTKHYGTTPALVDVSFAAADGEVAVLLGPNGAGKTTLVSVISGLLRPDAGRVVVGGWDLATDGVAARSHLGVAAQDVALVQSLSVRQNLRFFGSLARLDGTDLDRHIDELAADFDIGRLLDKKVLLLSGGQQRRVHVAAALVGRAKVLLLDEPTAGADLQSRQAIFARILRERDEGRTVLYTTHALDEVTSLGARVLILDGGRLIADSTVPELLAKHARAAVEVRFTRPVPRTPPSLGATVDGPVVRVSTDDPTTTIPQVLRCGRGIAVESIEIIQPGLEAAFLALTGRQFEPDGDGT